MIAKDGAVLRMMGNYSFNQHQMRIILLWTAKNITSMKQSYRL